LSSFNLFKLFETRYPLTIFRQRGETKEREGKVPRLRRRDIDGETRRDKDAETRRQRERDAETVKQPGKMIEITCNDRLGKKIRVKCNPDDTIGDLKKMVSAQTGTRPEKIVLKKWYTIFKDHIQLQDYEIHDGMNLELYYQ